MGKFFDKHAGSGAVPVKDLVSAEPKQADAPAPEPETMLGQEPVPEPEIQEREVAAPAILAEAISGHIRAGVRLMMLGGEPVIGLWSDLDSTEFREALKAFGSDHCRIVYLDGPGVPDRYRERRVRGEPVPKSVLAAMEVSPKEPWIPRDQILKEMGWRSKPTGMEKYLAEQLDCILRRARRRPKEACWEGRSGGGVGGSKRIRTMLGDRNGHS